MGKGSRKVSTLTAAADGGTDLEALIHSHSLFFDRLVELIPARYYLPVDEDKPWYEGLSKAAKASARAESRKNIKAARRARLDPAKSNATTVDLLKKSIEAEKAAADSTDEDAVADEENDDRPVVDRPRPPTSDDRAVTYEELRQRLHRRIAELRSGRNTRPETNMNRLDKTVKRKSKNRSEEEEASTSDGKRKREGNDADEEKKKKKTSNRGVDAVTPDISFGQVKLGGEDSNRRKKRKLSKQQELERAEKLEEAKKDPEKGQEVAKRQSWKAAVSRAAGVKVHDDPKLLKESIKKEKKRQQKHAEKWKERVKTTQKARAEKQKTRSGNIKERIDQKKQRRIEKREKKLMRPGFEGRKEGYINE